MQEATAGLAAKRSKLELYYDNNRSYADAPDCASDATTSSSFTFVGTTCTASAYTLTATGQGSMSGFTYTINNSNTKTSSTPSSWGGHSSDSCWILGKSGSC
ncbi:MAG: type IV pilin protein [Zoogloeaceae bacterium]|nr:type IV pilin protein [Zoogloeaceae bacterium]